MKYIEFFEAKKEYKYEKTINVKDTLSFAYANLPRKDFYNLVDELFKDKFVNMYCDGRCHKRIKMNVAGFQFHESFMSTGRPTIGVFNKYVKSLDPRDGKMFGGNGLTPHNFHFIDLDLPNWLPPHDITIYSNEPFTIGKYEKELLFLKDTNKYNL
jgi:hypothetical protein